MPKKSFIKKKKHQETLRQKVVKDGLYNNAAGEWVTLNHPTLINNGKMAKHLKTGYKVGR